MKRSCGKTATAVGGALVPRCHFGTFANWYTLVVSKARQAGLILEAIHGLRMIVGASLRARHLRTKPRTWPSPVWRPAMTAAKRSLVADDPDLVVVDFDLRDDGLQVGLPRLGVAGIELFSHELGEGGEPIRGDHRTRLGLGRDPIEGSLREIALRLECVDPFLQVSVKIDDAILDRAIEPIEFFVGDSEFGH